MVRLFRLASLVGAETTRPPWVVQGIGDTGVWAQGNTGIFAVGREAGSFAGDVDISGNLHVYQEVIVHTNLSVTGDLYVYGGTKSVVVPFPDGTHRQLYCMESRRAGSKILAPVI